MRRTKLGGKVIFFVPNAMLIEKKEEICISHAVGLGFVLMSCISRFQSRLAVGDRYNESLHQCLKNTIRLTYLSIQG